MVQKQELLKLISHYPVNDSNKLLTQLFVEKYDDFWSKKNVVGQVTAACWVVNKLRTKALLTHHLKLNRWLQLGGHLERLDNSIIDSCIRELKEESGLSNFQIINKSILDIDVHKIPTSKKGVAEHFHFDLRFLIEADENEPIKFDQTESNKVAWVLNEEIKSLTNNNESILRMMDKVKML